MAPLIKRVKRGWIAICRANFVVALHGGQGNSSRNSSLYFSFFFSLMA
jgi:hypothetical protein